ncbi:restriction endonuclease subunit S [Nocardiopsis rhodophaea]|uniref:restriction endonuclease subunit S n=1 Tax=Nocardiopsis rhodophaea TaxID=280238 RepID=UPI0031E40A07
MPTEATHFPNSAAWPVFEIRDVAHLIRRGTSPSYTEASDVRAIGQRCVQESGFNPDAARPHDANSIHRTFEVSPGDVLVNSTGTGTIGRSCVFREKSKFIIDSHITVIRLRDFVLPEWIDLLLRSPWGQRHLESRCYAGSTNQVELSREALSRTRIPVPPVHEQHRIVEALDSIVASEQAIRTTISKLQTTRSAAMESLLGQLSWNYILDDALESPPRNGYSPPESQAWNGIKMLGLACLTPEGFKPLQLKNAPPSVASNHPAILNDGDVLMSRANTRDLVGLTATYRNIGTKCIYPDLMMRLEISRQSSSEFIEEVLRSNRARHQIKNLAQGTSESMVKISASSARGISIPLPPRAQQDQILGSVQHFSQRIDAEQRNLKKLQSIKHGLANDLLAGQVRGNDLA